MKNIKGNITNHNLAEVIDGFVNRDMKKLATIYNHYVNAKGELIEESWIGDGAEEISEYDVNKFFGPCGQAIRALLMDKHASVTNAYFVNDHLQQFVSFQYHMALPMDQVLKTKISAKIEMNRNDEYITTLSYYDENNGQLNVATGSKDTATGSLFNAYHDLDDQLDYAF